MKGYIALALCLGLVSAYPGESDSDSESNWGQLMNMMNNGQMPGQLSGQVGCNDCAKMINQEMMKKVMMMLFTHSLANNMGGQQEQQWGIGGQQKDEQWGMGGQQQWDMGGQQQWGKGGQQKEQQWGMGGQQKEQQWGMGGQQKEQQWGDDEMISYCLNLLSKMMSNYGGQSQRQSQTGGMSSELQNVMKWMQGQTRSHMLKGQQENAVNMQRLMQWVQQMHAKEQNSRQLSKEDLKEMKQMKEFKDMSKMAEFVMHYMAYKEKSSKFEDAMYHVCFVVNVTETEAKKSGRVIFPRTANVSLESLMEQVSGMDATQTAEFIVNLFFDDNGQFNEVFFRMASAACLAGKEYHEVAMAFKELKKGKSSEESEGRMMMGRD